MASLELGGGRQTKEDEIDPAVGVVCSAKRGQTVEEGQVLALPAPPGTQVEAGDTVVILEAMKMEHAVTAPRPGVVADVAVREGEQVTRGQRLAVVEPG